MNFASLPYPYNANHQPRRAGFEFEMAVITPQTCATLICDIFGGTLSSVHSLEYHIKDSCIGDFTVELDAKPIKNIVAQLENANAGDNGSDWATFKQQISEWIGQTAGTLVPVEIVSPPMPIEQFNKLDTLIERLREHHAEGTRARWTNAFGMHVNIEIASDDAIYLCNILRAFLLLYPWLKHVMKVDISRRVLTYIDPFPKEYAMLVLRPEYQPDMLTFRNDYIAHNPTRSRALDFLPLLSHILPDTIDSLPEDMQDMVKSRPAFHYRLPNCDVDNANWSIATDWNYWVRLEQLAGDSGKRASMMKRYVQMYDEHLYVADDAWLSVLQDEFGYEKG